MNEELFSTKQMKPADDKIITTAKCPICGEIANVYKFGKGQGRISHHGHSVCFSSREVRALVEPVRDLVTSPADRHVDQIVEPAAAPVDPAETKIVEQEGETLTFGWF